MKLVVKTIAAAFAFLTMSFASAMDFEMNMGMGLSGEAVAGLAEYSYTDGSITTLNAGQGLGVMLKQSLTSIGKVDLVAGIGFQWGFIADSSGVNSYYDGFSYFPAELNANFNVTPEITVYGGLSYLLLPAYKYSINDYKVTYKSASNIGYNLGLQYNLISTTSSKMYFFGKYAANTVSYTEGSDSDGAVADLTGLVDDEVVNSLQAGFGFSF